MDILGKHGVIERNATLLLSLSLVVVSIGGIVEVAPLFYFQNTIEKVEGMRPYTPLELAGRDIYIREGCYTCHSQMVRPFRAEALRYGQLSVAGEFVYDHPFQWGSKRTGPDLHRVGGKYNDEWHRIHLNNPRDLVPESNMPAYPWLNTGAIDPASMAPRMKALRIVGVPYTDEMVTDARADLAVQASTDGDTSGLLARYPKAATGDFDGQPGRLTEMDALIAYLQVLGRMVDFTDVRTEDILQ